MRNLPRQGIDKVFIITLRPDALVAHDAPGGAQEHIMSLAALGLRPRTSRSAQFAGQVDDPQALADRVMLQRLHQTLAAPQLQNALFGGGAVGATPVRSVGSTRSARSTGSAQPGAGSPTNQAALDAARSQIGVRERTGHNDGVPAQRYSQGRKEAWCANFVSWAHRKAGKPLPGNQRSLASVQYMESQMKKAGKVHRGTPKPGDIIFFKNRGQSDRGSGRHVGIVERVSNGQVHTIEGNSGNMVRRRSYDLRNARISGYGRP